MFYKVVLVLLISVLPSFADFDFTKLKSFKSRFVQTVTNSSNKKVQYRGNVFIKNTGKILWQYKSPIIKNVYIIDGVAIIDEPELEQAIYTKLEKDINIIKLLEKAKEIKSNLYETKIYNTSYLIGINKSKISFLSYEDELQNRVKIEFVDVYQNIKLDDSIFQFLLPKYYDIIER